MTLVVGFLITTATIIGYKSILNIGIPHDLPKPFTLLVLSAIIIWKEISYRIVIKKAKITNSSSLKADAWHHRSDAITSIAAFIGISIALFFGKGYESADDWAALFASGFILYNSYLIFRPALGEILDEHVYDGPHRDRCDDARPQQRRFPRGDIDGRKKYHLSNRYPVVSRSAKPESTVTCEARRNVRATRGTINFIRAARPAASASATAASWMKFTNQIMPTHTMPART